MSSFTELAEQILVDAKKLDAHLASEGKLPFSSKEENLIDLPPDLEAARNNVINTTQTMKRMAQGSRGILWEIIFGYTDELALRAIYKYKLAQALPLDSPGTTFAALATTSGLSENLVERFLRQAMANHIFTEDAAGLVQHTAASRLLATDSDAYDCVGMMTSELSPAAQRALDALDRWPGSDENCEAGFSLQNEPGTAPFAFLARHPERARRLGAGMGFFSRGQGWDLAHLLNGYDWGRVDREGAVFVDVGGGQGSVPIYLARNTGKMKFVVQDLPGTVEAGKAVLPEDLRDRIRFEVHDFFTEQPVVGADVYFFRWILHNWSDKYAVEILRKLIPALKNDARIIVYEFVLKDGPEMRWTEKQPRNLDMVMMSLFNSPERSPRAWEELFQKAHSNMRLRQITKPPGSILSIIEAVWEGGE